MRIEILPGQIIRMDETIEKILAEANARRYERSSGCARMRRAEDPVEPISLEIRSGSAQMRRREPGETIEFRYD